MDQQFDEKLTIFWDSDAIVLVDQTKLPVTYELVRITTLDQLINAIKTMKVR